MLQALVKVGFRNAKIILLKISEFCTASRQRGPPFPYNSHVHFQSAKCRSLWQRRLRVLCVFLLTCVTGAQTQSTDRQKSAAPGNSPTFQETDAVDLLDRLQSALQNYNRKQFLAAFDPARMRDFGAFREQIKLLFDGYDSFTVTYHIIQTAMEGDHGVVLADFGLDADSNSEDKPDLRRHTQLRLLAGWTGKDWKIVELSPKAIFRSQ